MRLTAAACLALLCIWHPAPATGSKTLQSKREALSKVKKRIQNVEHEIKANRKRQNKLTQTLREAETRIGKLSSGVQALDDKISAQQRKITGTQAKRQRVANHLKTSRQQLARQALAAYMMGRQSRLKLLLEQQNPDVIGRVMTYYDYFAHSRAEAIARVEAQAQELRDTQEQLNAQLQQMQDLRHKRGQKLAQLKGVHTARAHTLAALKHHMDRQHKKLASLEKNRKNLENLIESLRKALADIPVQPGKKRPFRDLKGHLPWPLQGKVLARFGESKNRGHLRWQGLWLAAPQGAPIHAVAYGRVVYEGWMPGYGLLLIVDHGHGYYSLYAHNQSVVKRVGEPVKPGTEIARAGETGGHTQSGVYFEIRKGKKPLNPLHWLTHR